MAACFRSSVQKFSSERLGIDSPVKVVKVKRLSGKTCGLCGQRSLNVVPLCHVDHVVNDR